VATWWLTEERRERERKVRREIVAGLATTILGERYYTLRSPHYTLAGYKCTACSGGVMFSPRPDVPLSIPCQHRPACSAYESITHMHLRRHQMVAGGLVVTANWGAFYPHASVHSLLIIFRSHDIAYVWNYTQRSLFPFSISTSLTALCALVAFSLQLDKNLHRWRITLARQAAAATINNEAGTFDAGLINPLMSTLKQQSSGLLYSSTIHWPLINWLLYLVQRGGDWAGPQCAQAHPSCTKCNN